MSIIEALADSKTIEIEVAKAEKERPTGTADPATKSFVFDHAYGWDTAQRSLYEDLGRPIVEQALRGFNGTIFAYGQTGSGKTFSMMGDESNPGIIPLLNFELFDRLAAMQAESPSRSFLVLVSFLEIYNECIKDLLNPSDKQLMIREHPDLGVYVQDLAELVVKDAADVVRLLDQGQKVRHVAATAMNDRSSRSHSCFTIKIEQKTVERAGNKEKTTTLGAKINLVDLAGSERAEKTGATGETLKQGASINKSLSALGNVINALAEGKVSHVPYRDSKLTRLLQHSLGGNSLTVMVAAVSPADDNYDETLSTLQYANRAKNIKNVAKRNEDVNQQVISQLREEIEALRRQLAQAQTSSAAGGADAPMSEEKKAEMEELLAVLERAKQQSWEDKQRLSQLYEEERKRNLENENKIRAVMQTIKEDNLELMKRMRALVTERTRLTKRYRALKDAHSERRNQLVEQSALYEVLYEEWGGETGTHREELEAMVDRIEQLHIQVDADIEELRVAKAAIKENERLQMEERAEAAAQRMLLEEDAELRKAIQEEERAKLEKANEALIQSRLEEERRKLREDAERDRSAALEKFSASHVSEREQELELSLIQIQSEKSLLLLELSQLKAEHAAEVNRLNAEHRKATHDAKVEELHMFREMVSGFEEDRAATDAKIAELGRLLGQAVSDIQGLHARNTELQRQVVEAAAWEPPVY